ncbi:MAG: hypothetical protein HDQ98_00415 [Lachnospiraceae bacterium]|nr:hypothetical protein [Lachnospiraceae bacterium]
MSDGYKNEEEQYTESLIQGSVESLGEVQQAFEQVRERERERAREIDGMIEEAQLQAWEEEEKRIAQVYGISETDRYGVGNLMKAYAEQDRYNEYLVHGAILTCSSATTDVFVLPDKKEIVLDRSMDETARCRMALNLKENHANINNLAFATIGDTVINENIFPFNCNCMMADVSRKEAEVIANDSGCSRFGVCRHLMRLNEQWDNMPRKTGYMRSERRRPVYIAAGVAEILDEPNSKIWVLKEEEGITMTSVLFCKRGGLIQAVTSGQNVVEEVADEKVEGISCEALCALMELEVLDNYANEHGYLVIENGVLIGIKPHLANDGLVTFGFGDALFSDEELAFYTERLDEKSAELLSRNVSDYERMKNVVIPVEVCFDKLISDTNDAYKAINDYFEGKGYKLSQDEMDALIIARYQIGSLNEHIRSAVENGAERDALYDVVYEAHGGRGYESRTTVEMNIFFEGNPYVEGGLHETVIVRPFLEYVDNKLGDGVLGRTNE